MSSCKQKPFAVGDIVFDKQSGKVGTVKAVEDFRKGYDNSIVSQVVVLSTGETPRDYVALDVPRLPRGEDGPLARLGVPPKLKVGDWVFCLEARRLVQEVLPHGAIRVCIPYVGDRVVQWPNYRKVKKDKGGLGKFKAGDLVRLTSAANPQWLPIIDMHPSGLGLRVRQLDGSVGVFVKDLFAKLERNAYEHFLGASPVSKASALEKLVALAKAPTHCPATVISKEKLEPLQPPVSEPGVKLLNDTLQLVKDFAAEKDGGQAARILEKVTNGLNKLNDVCMFAPWSAFEIIFNTKTKEVVNAHA